MIEMIVRRMPGRKAGDRIKVRAHEARALALIGAASYVPPPKPAVPRKSKGEYLRRDMVAEQQPAVVVVTEPADLAPQEQVATATKTEGE